MDVRVVTADGDQKWVTAQGERIQQDTGSVVCGYLQDVTEQKTREQQLEEYETVLETLTDAVYVLDENGRFTYANDEFVEVVGYERDTVIGNTPSLVKAEESVETAERQLGRLLSDDGPETVRSEVTIQPRDGDPVTCEDHMCVLSYRAGASTAQSGRSEAVQNTGSGHANSSAGTTG